MISRKAINEVIKLAAKADEAAMVDISVEENKVFFSFGSRRLYTVSVPGRFPDCARVFPKGDLMKAVVSSKLLSDSVNSICCMTDDRSKAAKFTFEDSLISMEAKKDSGDGEDSVDCDYQGTKVEIGLNASHINDFLKHVGSNNVEILLTDGQTQVELRIEGDDSWRGVIMTMSL
jgi:DNA polymerase-3 subunit beta